MTEGPTARAQNVVFATLLVAYASFYLCRANVDAALPFLSAAYGYDKEKLGALSSIGILAYAIGKVALGVLGDAIGGRRVILLALGGSVVASFLIGTTGSFVMLAVFVVANRFSQSGGWGGLVHVVSRWFPPERYGRVMGGLSTSYEIGNVVALVLSGVVAGRFGWRALFVVNPGLLLMVGVGVAFILRGEPPQVARTVAGGAVADAPAPARARLAEVLPQLAANPGFWFALALSFLLTFVRTGFLTWTPMLLAEVGAHSPDGASQAEVSLAIIRSAIFPGCGVIAAIAVGRVSDRFGPGRRAPVMAVSLALLVGSVLALGHAGVSSTATAVVAVGACGFFLSGPYSLLAGACSLDVAAGQGAATAAGCIDGIGYLGATMSGVVIGTIAARRGWTSAFDVVAAAAAVAMMVSAVWSFVRPTLR